MELGKRQRLAPGVQRLERRLRERDALTLELKETFNGFSEPDFLWSTQQVFDLVHPSINRERHTPPRYMFVGRERSKQLLERMLAQEGGQHMQVLGCKGSGKTTALRAISGYLLASKRSRVVHIVGARFIDTPFYTLLDALLLACGKEVDDELTSFSSLQNLVDWCAALPRADLMFVVDDWDVFERHGGMYAQLEKDLVEASSDHVLVKVSSINSRQRQLWCQSDKADDHIETFHFDGPYRSDELVTWMAQSRLNDAQLQDCDRLTGGIPGLLRIFEEAIGDEEVFGLKILGPYTLKLNTKFIANMNSQPELAAALKLVIEGEREVILTSDKVDMTCFYLDEEEQGVYHILSPYLRSMAEMLIMEQHERLNRALLVEDMQAWATAVRVDCDEDIGSTNPPRIGWNVEGLTISHIRYNRELFGYRFKHYRKYARGTEKTVMAKLRDNELAEGVLLAPAAFNQKAVDLIIVRLVGRVLKIIGVQITVAEWKSKRRSNSHGAWRAEVLPTWMKGKKWQYEQEYYYVMPESVKLEKLEDRVPDAKFRKFADVDASLAEFDHLLNLAKPDACKKTEVVQCSGTTSGKQRCKNVKACAAGEAFFCRAHEKQAPT